MRQLNTSHTTMTGRKHSDIIRWITKSVNWLTIDHSPAWVPLWKDMINIPTQPCFKIQPPELDSRISEFCNVWIRLCVWITLNGVSNVCHLKAIYSNLPDASRGIREIAVYGLEVTKPHQITVQVSRAWLWSLACQQCTQLPAWPHSYWDPARTMNNSTDIY